MHTSKVLTLGTILSLASLMSTMLLIVSHV